MGLVVRADAESAAPFNTDSSSAGSNGAQAEGASGSGQAAKEASPPLPSGDLVYEQRNAGQRAATSFRLIFALPWRRFKKGSVLQLDVRFCACLSVPIRSRQYQDNSSRPHRTQGSIALPLIMPSNKPGSHSRLATCQIHASV